jgi:hypothetical protein
MTNLQLDWSTAEVSKGKLTVSLDDRPSDQWVARFERTARLLDHGTWPDIKLKKGEITVKGVEPGSEERLRFFLESVVQEANAGEGPEEEQAAASEDAREEEEEAAEDSSQEAADPDAEMTERFRSFGGEDRPGS